MYPRIYAYLRRNSAKKAWPPNPNRNTGREVNKRVALGRRKIAVFDYVLVEIQQDCRFQRPRIVLHLRKGQAAGEHRIKAKARSEEALMVIGPNWRSSADRNMGLAWTDMTAAGIFYLSGSTMHAHFCPA